LLSCPGFALNNVIEFAYLWLNNDVVTFWFFVKSQTETVDTAFDTFF